MTTWPEVPLNEVCREIVDCVNKTAPTVEYETPFKMIRTTNVKHGRIDLSSVKYVTEEIYEKWTRRSVPTVGDVILTREAPMGEVGMIRTTDQLLLGQRLMQYRANKDVLDPRFLLYSFQGQFLQRQIMSHEGSGSTVSHIRVPDAMKFKIRLAPLHVQHRIADILGSIDDKIEINRSMNRTLEQMAMAMYKHWFIDFGPFRDGGFVESELGLIPKGWGIASLEDLVGINMLSLPRTSPYETIQYIDISSVQTGRLNSTTEYGFSEAPSRAKRLVRHGDVIWSCVRPNRKSYYQIHKLAPNVVVSTGFVVLTPLEVPSSFLYAHTTTDAFVDYLTSNADGSAYPAVRPDTFAKAKVIVPPKSVLESFDEIVAPLYDLAHENEDESRTLIETRNFLLPQLLSGEVEVQDVAHTI